MKDTIIQSVRDTVQNDSLTTITAPELNLWGALFKIFFILIALIAMIYFFVFFTKKYLYRTGQKTSQGQINLKETFFLSPKSKLHLVKVGKKFLLIGEKDSFLECLTEYEESENHE